MVAQSPKKMRSVQQISVVSFIKAVCEKNARLCKARGLSTDIFQNKFIEGSILHKIDGAEGDPPEFRILKQMRL